MRNFLRKKWRIIARLLFFLIGKGGERTKMVVIRLARGGAKKRPFHSIVVADSRKARDGRFIERIGFYDPVAGGKAQTLRIDMERLAHWRARGAKPSPGVLRLTRRLRRGAGKKEIAADGKNENNA
jgi:small subunit ribosomal protein S16